MDTVTSDVVFILLYGTVGLITTTVYLARVVNNSVRRIDRDIVSGSETMTVVELRRRRLWEDFTDCDVMLASVASFFIWPAAWILVAYETTEPLRDRMRERFLDVFFPRPMSKDASDYRTAA